MERLQGPINSCFLGEHLEVNCLEQGFIDAESLRLEKEEQLLISSLEDRMPFLEMPQSVEFPQFFPFKESNFQTLLRLQHLKIPCEEKSHIPRKETQIQVLELESCITHESNDLQYPQYSASCAEKVGFECDQELPKSAENYNRSGDESSIAAWASPVQSWPRETHCPKFQVATRERRKRKRTRPTKNKEDAENQRMTHIAVERNRRRQMNDHLSVLRSLMPPSYIQRGDQASVIGGAIDFVKELEQLLQSLEAQKRMRKSEVDSNGIFRLYSPGYGMMSSTEEVNFGEGVKAENKSEEANIEVTLIQSHVNLKIQCQRRPGQLVKVIVAMEDLRLTILHLNITSSQASVLYSFNLKIEDDCKLVSANQIAEAVQQMFRFINGS